MTHPTWELKIDNDAALVLTPCQVLKILVWLSLLLS